MLGTAHDFANRPLTAVWLSGRQAFFTGHGLDHGINTRNWCRPVCMTVALETTEEHVAKAFQGILNGRFEASTQYQDRIPSGPRGRDAEIARRKHKTGDQV